MLVGIVMVSLSQKRDMEDSLHVRYSPQQSVYYFYWNSNTNRAFYWDTIYGKERCSLFIINNSSDTLLIERLHNNSTEPVYWELSPSKRMCNPGDTLVIKSRISRRHGPFSRQLQIQYHSSSNLNAQTWYLPYKGFFSDNRVLEQMQEAKRLKELEELKKANSNFTYYPGGQIKSKKNPKPENDSLPIYTEYYENGLLKFEEFNRKGIQKKAYDQKGKIKNEWDNEGLRTEYYSNGKVKYKEADERFSTTNPFRVYYYENGCLKRQEFANQTIIKEYDSLKCGKLLHHKRIETLEGRSPNGKVITHYKEGNIVGQTFEHHGKTRNEVKGEYLNGELVNGLVSYYSSTGVLLFQNKIVNSIRDHILSESEKQGQQINLLDVNGKKTGLWITDKATKQAIVLSNDFSLTYDDTKSFDDDQYEYASGDTFARVTFHDYGGIRHYLYMKDKQKRSNSNQEYALSFYPNGQIAAKSYQLKNGMQVSVNYSEDKVIRNGRRGDCGEMTFKDNTLVEIRSEREIEQLDDVAWESSSGNQKHLEDYCIEKGQFKHFELYNGFVYYYRKDGTLKQKEQVVNGIIQGNPRVNFKEPKLHSAALANDLNFNGWCELKEVENMTTISLSLKPEEVDEFGWTELHKFKSLSVIYANGLVYRLDEYANQEYLKSAIRQNKGSQMRRQRYPWEGPDLEIEKDVFVHVRDSVKTAVRIVYFPDKEAEFPGGMDSLRHWLKNNLIYPPNVSIEGKVYVSFLVLKDGSIAEVKIEKGLHPELEKEAKRLVRAMPKWKPAISNGLDVVSQMRLPILFKP